jgi:hypothetical protein
MRTRARTSSTDSDDMVDEGLSGRACNRSDRTRDLIRLGNAGDANYTSDSMPLQQSVMEPWTVG